MELATEKFWMEPPVTAWCGDGNTETTACPDPIPDPAENADEELG